MDSKMDPMGRAILDYVKRQGRAAEYWKTKKADRLRVFSPMFEEDEIPLTTLWICSRGGDHQTRLNGRVATEVDKVNLIKRTDSSSLKRK